MAVARVLQGDDDENDPADALPGDDLTVEDVAGGDAGDESSDSDGSSSTD